jgi:protein-S-isoprenylcysteine O-methyltransferase Ste14
MDTHENPDRTLSRRVLVQRWQAIVVGFYAFGVVYPFMLSILPWALSLLTPRFGWTERDPGNWNLLGLIPVLFGITGLIWVFCVGMSLFRKLTWPLELEVGERLVTATGTVLVTYGPFALSRNPIFASGLIALLGWALFYGSPVILVVTLVNWAVSDRYIVPREERALEARWGEAYRDYKRRVPRWLGMRRRG